MNPASPTAPLVLITGFLGSGKTTLLEQLLPGLENEGLAPFVLINDYRNARIDASRLTQAGRPVVPINGNCVCCDSIHELVEALVKMPSAAGRIALVEVNGTSDPAALLDHLLASKSLRDRFHAFLQITMVDVKRWQRRHWHNELERFQAATASHLIFTHTDSQTPERLASVSAAIHSFNPSAVATSAAALPRFLASLVGEIAQPPACPPHLNLHHLAHAFVGLALELPDPVDAQDLHAWLDSLPPAVLRAKGVARLVDSPGKWFTFQKLDSEIRFAELPQSPTAPPSAVLIGVHLDEPALRRQAADALRMPTKS